MSQHGERQIEEAAARGHKSKLPGIRIPSGKRLVSNEVLASAKKISDYEANLIRGVPIPRGPIPQGISRSIEGNSRISRG